MDFTATKPFPIAVLVSGTGTNLQALLDRVHGCGVEIVAVASNIPDAPALSRASEAGVETRVFRRCDYTTRQKRDEIMANWLIKRGARLVVLAGFMEILSERFLKRFPESTINVHPSLLPEYPGLRPIERAIADGATRFGVTVHLVDAGVDTGPIVLQERHHMQDAHDARQVLQALRPIEHDLLSKAVLKLVAQKLASEHEAVAEASAKPRRSTRSKAASTKAGSSRKRASKRQPIAA